MEAGNGLVADAIGYIERRGAFDAEAEDSSGAYLAIDDGSLLAGELHVPSLHTSNTLPLKGGGDKDNSVTGDQDRSRRPFVV